MKAHLPFAAYEIPLQVLSNGEHRYSYALDKDFFGLFEASLITQAQILMELEIYRQGNRLDCHFHAQGTMQVGCARCLEPLNWPVHDTSSLVVQLRETDSGPDSDEILVLPSSQPTWNVAQFMYESVHLHFPLRAVCQEASLPCSSKVPWSDQDLFTYQTSNDDPHDPRWDTLKQVNFH